MSTTRSKDGTSIAFDRSGEGPPVVLVHPAFGHRSFDPAMAELARLVSAQFTVFTYDRRGRGESGDTAPYAVEREIEDLGAIVARAGGNASVYGMSSGAVLALEAANQGLSITKLALNEPPFVVDDSRPPYPADYVAHLTKLVSSGRRGGAVEYAMANVGLPTEVVDQMRSQPMWPAFEAVAPTLVYDGTIMGDTQRGRPLPRSRVGSVKAPALVIVSSASPPWVHNSANALAELLPDAQVRTLEGDFHAIPPHVLAPALIEFFGGPASQGIAKVSRRRSA
jgi:pimeloyl-ACP methyl ester carboxylesterase